MTTPTSLTPRRRRESGLGRPLSFTKRTYKYRAEKPCAIAIDFVIGRIGTEYCTPFCGIKQISRTQCLLYGLTGYRWDGASGPTRDTDDSYFASYFHDILAQLSRETDFANEDFDVCVKAFDKLFLQLLKDAGMWRWRRWGWYRGLRTVDGAYARPEPAAMYVVHRFPLPGGGVMEPR